MEFISVDGGATKTVAIRYDDKFNIEAVGISGPSNFRTAGIAAFRKNIRDALQYVLSSGIKRITFALPGIKDSPESFGMIMGELKKSFPTEDIRLYNDGEAGFHCRFLDDKGIIIAAGTGLVSYGKLGGITMRSSGWGWFLDDEGGAFYIGRRALEETVKIMDGRGEYDSTLLDEIRDHFHLKNDTELINKIYRGRIDVRGISYLAILVSRNAIKGDFISKKIMEEAAIESSKAAFATYRKLGFPEKIKISGYGGVFRTGKWYWEMVVKELRDKISGADFLEPYFGYEAVLGSVVLTYRENGKNITLEDIEFLRKQLNEEIIKFDPEQRKKYLYF